jgi:hypothetical protein
MEMKTYLEDALLKRFEEMPAFNRKQQPDAFSRFERVKTANVDSKMEDGIYKIVSYSTLIAEVVKDKKVVKLNPRDYSRTTKMLKSRIKDAYKDYKFVALEGAILEGEDSNVKEAQKVIGLLLRQLKDAIDGKHTGDGSLDQLMQNTEDMSVKELTDLIKAYGGNTTAKAMLIAAIGEQNE